MRTVLALTTMLGWLTSAHAGNAAPGVAATAGNTVHLAQGLKKIGANDDGGDPRTTTIFARADTAENTDVSSVPATTPATRGEAPGIRTLPLVVMGAGSLVVVAGATLIAIDNDASPTAKYIRKTKPVGIGFAFAGGIAAAVGAILWIRTPEARSSPVAAVTPQSAYVGWRARF